MVDVHDKRTRSYNMSQIKGRNTSPELIVRRYLFSKGFRYRLFVKKLPGKPDIVLTKYKTVIFINGCFWHGHENCKKFVVPQTRTEWWVEKIKKNKDNDFKNIAKLKDLGWFVIQIYECELEKGKFENRIDQLLNELSK